MPLLAYHNSSHDQVPTPSWPGQEHLDREHSQPMGDYSCHAASLRPPDVFRLLRQPPALLRWRFDQSSTSRRLCTPAPSCHPQRRPRHLCSACPGQQRWQPQRGLQHGASEHRPPRRVRYPLRTHHALISRRSRWLVDDRRAPPPTSSTSSCADPQAQAASHRVASAQTKYARTVLRRPYCADPC
jgi:hypothetical protein